LEGFGIMNFETFDIMPFVTVVVLVCLVSEKKISWGIAVILFICMTSEINVGAGAALKELFRG
jgi:hypothetical protein